MNTRHSSSLHSEAAFESVIEAHLLDDGYVTLKSGFDPKRTIFPQVATEESGRPPSHECRARSGR